MTYEDKRKLFAWLFPNGLDEHGEAYGILERKRAKNIYSFTVNATLVAHGRFITKDKDGYKDKEILYEPKVYKSSLDLI
jgi:hypothetical protein